MSRYRSSIIGCGIRTKKYDLSGKEASRHCNGVIMYEIPYNNHIKYKTWRKPSSFGVKKPAKEQNMHAEIVLWWGK